MPAADRARYAPFVGVAIVLQLAAAAGAVAARAGASTAAAPVVVGTRPPAVARAAAPARAATAAPAPVRVTAAGLWNGTVVAEPLAVGGDGALAVPRTAGAVGWWAAGPRPGDAGAAVLVGHVDLDGRPGVFGGLAGAAAGAVVVVDAGRGATYFRVTEVHRYPKDRFPADAVYEPTARSELRLITCGGRFDRRTGHYEDNVVVTAVRA